MNYRICRCCGAALDPGERCDCLDSQSSGNLDIENAAPVLQHQDGKVETDDNNISTTILQNSMEDCQV